jgi:hypothetical protein
MTVPSPLSHGSLTSQFLSARETTIASRYAPSRVSRFSFAHLVQQWLFESPTAPPRLLKFRSGHQQPPHLIRYYGDDGKQILTASRDKSLRYTSVVRDSRSFELSQGARITRIQLSQGLPGLTNAQVHWLNKRQHYLPPSTLSKFLPLPLWHTPPLAQRTGMTF